MTSQLEKDESKLNKKLDGFYKTESAKLEKNIAAFYQTYGEDNIIEYHNLMASLPDVDKRLLIEQMDVFAKKYPEYKHLMPVRESIYKLNRLEGLQTSIYMQQVEIGAMEQGELMQHLEKVAKRGVKEVSNITGQSFNALSKKVIESTVNARWVDDLNFSDRIWGNRAKLAGHLNTEFAQAVARGDSYARIHQDMAERFRNVSSKQMRRLVYTEGSFVMNESTIKAFEGDYEEYKYDALMDSRTSDICRELDGKIFRIADRQPGVNFPPMHPNCRSTYLIVIPGEDGMENLQLREENGSIDANISKALDDVVIKGKETNTEHLTFLNASTGEYFVPVTSGGKSSVIIPPETLTKLENADFGSVICIHNHPSSSSFSAEDMMVASKYGAIKDMLVKGHDGTEYKMSMGDGIRPTARAIQNSYRTFVDGLDSKYRDLIYSDKMTMDEARKEHSNEAVTAVAEKFGWKYERILP